jgi:hypothetical protein
MDEKTIQSKIRTVFINKVAESPDFTESEATQIERIITSARKAEKMADELLKVIGGVANENS